MFTSETPRVATFVHEVFSRPRNAGAPESAWAFEKGERFLVAATVEIMREMRIDGRGELRLKGGNPLGRSAQFFQMRGWIARIKIAIRDYADPLSESCGEFSKKWRVGHEREGAGGLMRCPSGSVDTLCEFVGSGNHSAGWRRTGLPE